jgi:hypothetical protein
MVGFTETAEIPELGWSAGREVDLPVVNLEALCDLAAGHNAALVSLL